MDAPCYGSFQSSISAEKVASKSVRFSDVQIQNKNIYFLESQPLEKGRTALVKSSLKKEAKQLTSPEFNIRTRVHEYGGGAFLAVEEFVFFIHDSDQDIYQLSKDGSITRITNQPSYRYAEINYDKRSHRIFAVREDHTNEQDVKNVIVVISLETKKEKVLIEGEDFYSNPSVNEEGTHFTYLSWSHPSMPWDTTSLWVCELTQKGIVKEKRRIAGKEDESIFQPRWHQNDLYFISDRTGWWNLYRYKDQMVQPLWEKQAEFGLPQWVFGLSTYDVIDEDHLICTFFEKGKQQIGQWTISQQSFSKFEIPYESFQYVQVEKDLLVCIAASTSEPASVIAYDFKKNQLYTIRKSEQESIDPKCFSKPIFITCPSNEGEVYAFFYPPKNDNYEMPTQEKPPLIVKCHGGPTSFSGDNLSYQVQYWTSRGFAFVDVNYGGSTGFGRAYRERLKRNWGIVDVQDCVSVVKYLERQGWIDPKRVAIRGGSAGGYTTLACLAFTQQFSAGTSYYGVSDLQMLTKDTHKFESRYLDGLIGLYPEEKDIYRQRSPIHHIDQINSPVLLLQGEEDRVVPPDQSEKMFLALKKKKIPTAYLLFAQEQHGFRKSENIQKALEAEYYFYTKVFHIPVKGINEPIQIEGSL